MRPALPPPHPRRFPTQLEQRETHAAHVFAREVQTLGDLQPAPTRSEQGHPRRHYWELWRIRSFADMRLAPKGKRFKGEEGFYWNRFESFCAAHLSHR